MPRWSRGTAAPLAAASAVAIAVVLGVALRAQDPLGDPILAAEDPFTHLILVREHLADGSLDPLHEDGSLYPPGLHALLASFASLSGADLYALVHFGPVLFGALAILATAALLGRYEGAVAAFAGALALALMPEHIARTTLMAPTALDLALLPVLIWSLLEVLQGRLAWLACAAPVALFLVVAHPWMLILVAAAGLGTLGLYVLFPWQPARHSAPTLRGTGSVVALLGGVLGLAAASRWRVSGTGFAELGEPVVGTMTLALVAVPVLGALALAAVLLQRAQRRGGDAPLELGLPRRAAFAVAVAGTAGLALLLAAAGWFAWRSGQPEGVDVVRLLGWPTLGLAALGLLALPWRSSPVAHAGAGLFLATLPIVLLDPLRNPVWSQRAMVFLGVGAALLVGAAAARIAGTLAWRRSATVAPGHAARAPGRARAAMVGALVAFTVVGASLVAATPPPVDGGWYRYYSGCEFGALERVGTEAGATPGSLVVTGSWESRLVVAAFAAHQRDVWYKGDLFQSDAEAAKFTTWRSQVPQPTFVVQERYLAQDTEGASTAFLDAPPWRLAHRDCTGATPPAAEVLVYTLQPEVPKP